LISALFNGLPLLDTDESPSGLKLFGLLSEIGASLAQNQIELLMSSYHVLQDCPALTHAFSLHLMGLKPFLYLSEFLLLLALLHHV
jgi:hypothetical protein